MNKFVAIGLGAAAVVVALFIGAQIFGARPPAVPRPKHRRPVKRPQPRPRRDCRTLRNTRSRARAWAVCLYLCRAAHGHLDRARGLGEVSAELHRLVHGGDKATLGVASVDNLYGDPCDVTLQLRDPAVGPSVDDLTLPLPPCRDGSSRHPTAVTVDGFAGQYLEFVSASADAGCTELYLWTVNGDG